MTEPSIGFAQVTGWPSESAYRRIGLPTGSARNEATSGPTRSVGLGRSFLVEFAILYAPDPNFRKDAGLTGQQFALFPPDAGTRSTVPEGLHYVAEFIAPDVERDLIGRISALPLQPFQFGAYEGKRRVASFGFRYDYTLRRLEEAEPIPAWLSPIIARVEAFGGPATRIGQVLCTEYDSGVGIGWHRDKPHFDRIFGLSLGSPCKFRFRKATGRTWQRHTLVAEPRSLYLISGESRTVWEHSIPAVEAPRYSITFRTMVDPTR